MIINFLIIIQEYDGNYPDEYAELVAMLKEKIIEEGYHDPEEYEDDEWEF